MIFKATLKDHGHPQPKIPAHWDNATAIGIVNNTINSLTAVVAYLHDHFFFELRASLITFRIFVR